MKKQILVLGVACMLATACKLQKKEAEVVPPAPPSSQPQGTFKADPLAVAPDEKLADCMNTGDALDPRLKATQSFVTAFEIFPVPTHPMVPMQTTIDQIIANTGVVMSTSKALFEGHDIWWRTMCNTKNTDPNVESCQIFDKSDEYTKISQDPAYEFSEKTCIVETESKPEETKIEYGTYTFADGRVVQARQMTVLKAGIINCADDKTGTITDAGQGEISQVYISSVDVPMAFEPWVTCGTRSNFIFSYHDTKIGGVLVQMQKSELRSASGPQ